MCKSPASKEHVLGNQMVVMRSNSYHDIFTKISIYIKHYLINELMST